MLTQIIELTAIFGLSLLLFKYYPKFSIYLGLYTQPESVDVTQSSKATGAGIIFPISLAIYIFFNINTLSIDFDTTILILSCFLMALLGFFDDFNSLSLKLRLFCQTTFVTLTIIIFLPYLFINIDTVNFLVFLVILFLGIWLLNSFNFIDGADGLLGVNALMIFSMLSMYCLLGNQYILSLMLFNFSFVLLSFLIYNWHPSKLFMGDAGSLFLGSVSLILIIYLYAFGVLKPSTLFITFSLILIETTSTLLVRIYRRENFFSGRHNLHAYQQLARQPKKGALPAKISILLTLLWILPMSFISHIVPSSGIVIALISSLPLIIISYIYGPHRALKMRDI